MGRREVRSEQHGTLTGYTYGCRCVECRSCHREYRTRRTSGQPDTSHTCEKCGRVILKRNGVRGAYPKKCARCGAAARRAPRRGQRELGRLCQQCGDRFVTRRKAGKFCSRGCADQFKARYGPTTTHRVKNTQGTAYREANSSEVIRDIWVKHQAATAKGSRGVCRICGKLTSRRRCYCSDSCRAQSSRNYYYENRDHQLELKRRRDRRGVLDQWTIDNRDYRAASARRWRARVAAELARDATVVRAPWQPHEDALLSRVPSNVAAASALGRTLDAVKMRRAQLRKLEVA